MGSDYLGDEAIIHDPYPIGIVKNTRVVSNYYQCSISSESFLAKELHDLSAGGVDPDPAGAASSARLHQLRDRAGGPGGVLRAGPAGAD